MHTGLGDMITNTHVLNFVNISLIILTSNQIVEDNMLSITRQSMFTGIVRTKEFDITEDQYYAWVGGKKIQDAMPNLSPDDREFLMTGATPEEWDALCSNDEPEDNQPPDEDED